MGDALEKAAKALGTLALVLAMGALGSMLASLPVMLALGVLHNDWSAKVPALGFWATYLLLWGVAAFLAHLRRPFPAK